MPEEASENWRRRHEQWLRYVTSLTESVESGRGISLGPSHKKLRPPPAGGTQHGGSRVVFCAPHPDDEALSGALALRLRLESGARVTNVAITLGSNEAQRPRRLRELESACSALGFSLVVPQHPSGFDNVNQASRREKPSEWAAKVQTLREILDRESPEAVFAPHARDFNSTHVGTHDLVIEALEAHLEAGGRKPVLLIETEFWHQIERPNLMIGLSAGLVAAQLAGIAEYGGEMARNPYHLLHPCRLMDNVRRGSEVIGGQGVPGLAFLFAELYRVRWMAGKDRISARPGGLVVSPDTQVDLDLLRSRFLPQTKG
ncbi:MAG: PIG-L deacetylase family protein [Terriglobia bacterium]